MRDDVIKKLREFLDYDPKKGSLVWRIARGRARRGSEAGWLNAMGYKYMKIAGVETTLARFIWAHAHGEFPSDEIEHVNGDPLDCRIENLRVRTVFTGTELTVDRLRRLFDYNPETGVFTRKERRGRIIAGSVAGCEKTENCGYRRVVICVDGRLYKAHHLAWLYVFGRWPDGELDHRDGDATNNSIGNLRLATRSQNSGNCKKPITNTSGFKGVHWHSTAGRWTSQIKVGGEKIYLGLFDTPDEAHEAYKSAAIKHRGDFARWE